jgi:alkylated DNA repair protein (DNA oxidative demethylase)
MRYAEHSCRMPPYRMPFTMRPEGFTYRGEFLSADEERSLVANVEHLPFSEVRMHGIVARRMTIHFGWSYDYAGWKIAPADPPPEFLRPLVARCADAASVPVESLAQVMVARYPPDAAIGWHRDAPMFGVPVIGVSLLSSCVIRFRRKSGEGWETHAQLLEPRSLYLLDGPARTQWQHSIPKTKELRYSITMRTLRKTQTAAPAA